MTLKLTKKYELVKTVRGKELVVMTGPRPKLLARMAQLRASQRKGVGRNKDRVAYSIRESPIVVNDPS